MSIWVERYFHVWDSLGALERRSRKESSSHSLDIGIEEDVVDEGGCVSINVPKTMSNRVPDQIRGKKSSRDHSNTWDHCD